MSLTPWYYTPHTRTHPQTPEPQQQLQQGWMRPFGPSPVNGKQPPQPQQQQSLATSQHNKASGSGAEKGLGEAIIKGVSSIRVACVSRS